MAISGGNDSRKRHEKRLIFKIGTIHPHGLNEQFSFIWTLHSFCFCGQKRWLLTFSLYCLCSSTSPLFTSHLRLAYWSTLKIANDLPCCSHLIGLFSVTRLSLLYKFTRFLIYFLILTDEGPMLETLDYTIHIGSTPTFLYFDLYLYSAYAAHYIG